MWHARTVVREDRLGHEGGGLAGPLGHVLDDVLVDHQTIGLHQKRRIEDVDLGLAGGAHLVVVNLHGHPDLQHLGHHLRADILLGVVGRHREVAFLVAHLVAQVAAFLLPSGVPGRFPGVHRVIGHVAVVAHLREPGGVEDEELGFRAPVGSVGDAACEQVLLGIPGYPAGVLVIPVTSDRVLDEAVHHQGAPLEERIRVGGGGVGNQEHVRLFDGLESTD